MIVQAAETEGPPAIRTLPRPSYSLVVAINGDPNQWHELLDLRGLFERVVELVVNLDRFDATQNRVPD